MSNTTSSRSRADSTFELTPLGRALLSLCCILPQTKPHKSHKRSQKSHKSRPGIYVGCCPQIVNDSSSDIYYNYNHHQGNSTRRRKYVHTVPQTIPIATHTNTTATTTSRYASARKMMSSAYIFGRKDVVEVTPGGARIAHAVPDATGGGGFPRDSKGPIIAVANP